MMRRVIIFIFFLLLDSACFASDENREAEFADGIAKTLAIGKSVSLDVEGKKFLGLYTQTEKVTNKGTVILLHDLGGHPNQPSLIYGLRIFLPEHDWATLALQMPLREAGVGIDDYYGLFPEALARIKAGINYAKTNGAENIVVVGYGLGALMAVYAQSEQVSDIKALVAISLSVPSTENKAARTLDFINKIKIPMLDIYGALDLPDVTESARNRRLSAKENTAYRQIKIDDEASTYLHDEGLLVKRIYSWLGVTVGRTSVE